MVLQKSGRKFQAEERTKIAAVKDRAMPCQRTPSRRSCRATNRSGVTTTITFRNLSPPDSE